MLVVVWWNSLRRVSELGRMPVWAMKIRGENMTDVTRYLETRVVSIEIRWKRNADANAAYLSI